MSHFKAKMHQIRSLSPFVSVHLLCLRWSLILTCFAIFMTLNACSTPKKTNLLHVINAGGESSTGRPQTVMSSVPTSPFRPV